MGERKILICFVCVFVLHAKKVTFRVICICLALISAHCGNDNQSLPPPSDLHFKSCKAHLKFELTIEI